MLGASAKMNQLAEDKSFHFTVLDHKPVVIARDFLILQIMDELTTMRVGEKASYSLHFLLYYIYLAPVMPKCIYRILQRQIAKSIDILEGRRSMLTFLDVPQAHRADIVRVLREWQSEAFEQFGTRRVRKQAVSLVFSNAVQQQMQFGQELEQPPPKGCEKQAAFYRKTGILMMSSDERNDFVRKELPELGKAYDQFNPSSPRSPSEDILDAVDSTWATNVTMVDLDWEHNREEMEIDVGHDPFQLAAGLEYIGFGLVNDGCTGLYDHMSFWFNSVILCLGLMKHRIKIEVCLGDAACVLEQIRYGTIGYRKSALPAANVDDANQTNASSTEPFEDIDSNTSDLAKHVQAIDPEIPS